MRTWSKHQEAIFDFGANGKGNAIVKAVAGSGKSTTLVELIKRMVGNSIFLAFNKSIAEELKSRGVNARTFHSMCFSPVLRFKGAHAITTDKLRKLVDSNMSGDDAKLYGAFICKLVGLARQTGIGCLVPDTEQEWINIVEHHDMELESEVATMLKAIYFARNLLNESNASPMVDFDDLLYLAVKDGIVLPKFDNVLVDEAQDTNAIQRAILRKIMHEKSRLVACGDGFQSCYGFRGADAEAFKLIETEFNCTSLPLSVSYRCATSIINYAKQWVAEIEAAPNAPAGEVIHLDVWDANVFAPNDLVVCRTTKPLISL